MKTAGEWNSKFDWVGNHTKEIRAIQADALKHAAELLRSDRIGIYEVHQPLQLMEMCAKAIEAEAAKL